MIAAYPFRLRRLPLLVLLLAAAATAAPAQLASPQSLPMTTYGAPRGLTPRFPSSPLLGDPNDPAEALARYLRTLSDSPNDLGALTGAGHAALAIGDANAALAFYARAEELAPRDGRIKAGLGSAMLQLEKPKEAIGLFDEATDLGVAEVDIASDRGLAWDLRGDARRAQRDYALALRANPDDETKRRMALSLAISGDDAGANALLDPLLRRQDRAAWRARAFILAMSGDVAKADVVARSAMSPAQVTALHPFLTRLASLRPAQKALAVNFGEMPSDGKVYSTGELAAIDGQPPIRFDSGLVPVGAPLGPRRGDSLTTDTGSGDEGPVSTAPRRRPGLGDTATPADRAAPSLARSPAGLTERQVELAQAAPPPPAAHLRAVERPRSALMPRPTPIVAAPAAAAPAPIFITSAPPVVTTVAASPERAPPSPAATQLADASGGPLPSLSALDPANEERAPRPQQLAALQTESRAAAPPPAAATAQDQAVALPSVGYKLPPAKPKPPPVEHTAKPPAGAKLQSAAKPKHPEDAKADQSADDPKAGSKAKARVHGEKTDGDKDEAAPTKPAARTARTKTPSAETTDDNDKSSSKKTSGKAGGGKKDAADKADSATAKKDATKKGSAKKDATDDADGSAKKDAKGKDAAAKDTGKKTVKKGDDDSDARSAKGASQRVWVQVAGGATKGDLPKAWSKLKGKAPALAKGQSIYTTPLKATNRLLVGPFKSADEAQAYVNRMGKSGLSGFTFTSDKGQQVEKLATDK